MAPYLSRHQSKLHIELGHYQDAASPTIKVWERCVNQCCWGPLPRPTAVTI